MIKFQRLFATAIVLQGCAAPPPVVVSVASDSVRDAEKFSQDYKFCKEAARTRDLRSGTETRSALVTAAAVGLDATCVIGTAGIVVFGVLGRVGASTPVGIIGTHRCGSIVDGMTEQKEIELRENVMRACLAERGYEVLGPAGIRTFNLPE